MKNALIGYTGFVGSNLNRQYDFNFHFNSRNFSDMRNQEFDLTICAGISAVKWKANKEPEEDWAKINALSEVLKQVKSKQFVLISTIDVYPVTQNVDESFDCSSIKNHAYGAHRLNFEKFCLNHFTNCTVIRLPALFGNGLKKNVIFDLLNNNMLDAINTKSSFQYYYLNNLWKDIHTALKNDIKLVNLFTEPITTSEIIEKFFFGKEVGKESTPTQHYNLFTKYATCWGEKGSYISGKMDIMKQISEFILEYTSKSKNQIK